MSDKQQNPCVHVTDDKQSAVIEFSSAGGAGEVLMLTLDQLTAFIRDLGDARHQMVVGKILPPLLGERINVVFNTRWYIAPDPMTEGSVLSFFHPGFGLVGFVVPKDQLPEMVRLLTIHLSIQPSSENKLN